VTRTFNPYSAYKESGVPWLGEVPAHWEVLPGRACYREKKVPNTGLKETTVLSLSYGQIVVKPPEKLHGLVPASFETYQIVDPGDIIIRPTDLQNDWNSLRFGLSRHRGIITSAYMCFHTQDALTRDYGHLLLHTYDLMKIFYGLGSGLRQNLDWKDFKYLPCLAPPPAGQRAIAAFLDHHDRLTRRYIRAQQRLIKLLIEQKQALIQQAVTRGLDPDVPLKDSGVEWLGKIPAHWEIIPLKNLSIIQSGLTLGKNYIGRELVEYPYLRVANVQDGRLDLSQIKTVLITEEEVARCTLQDGDVLMTEGGDPDKLGRGCVWEDQIKPCLHQNHIFAVRPNSDRLLPYFLAALLTSQYAKTYFLRTAKQTTNLASTNKTTIGQFSVLLPSLEEQREILGVLESKTAQVQQAITHTQSQIALVREYHTRLIADVVTGKLDVQDVTLPTDEEAHAFDDVGEGFDDEAIDADDLDTEEDADADD